MNFASPTGGTVSGVVPVSFNYSDNIAVTAVDLYVNGHLYGNSTQEPFNFSIDTTVVWRTVIISCVQKLLTLPVIWVFQAISQ
ncbi:MAG: hypothetical protein KDF59_12835 [Nitrosomonas sp.]|nr:hypothetical protein [Nitrosomonas sp.]